MIASHLLRSENNKLSSISGKPQNVQSSPGVGLRACDVLQLLLQHQELSEVSLLCLCGLLLVVGPQALHLLSVTLLQLQLFHLFFSPQPLQFLTRADRWWNSLFFHS